MKYHWKANAKLGWTRHVWGVTMALDMCSSESAFRQMYFYKCVVYHWNGLTKIAIISVSILLCSHQTITVPVRYSANVEHISIAVRNSFYWTPNNSKLLALLISHRWWDRFSRNLCIDSFSSMTTIYSLCPTFRLSFRHIFWCFHNAAVIYEKEMLADCEVFSYIPNQDTIIALVTNSFSCNLSLTLTKDVGIGYR